LLGETHPDTLVSLNLLATIYFYSEQFDKAEELYSECLEKRKALLGENHPLSLATMDNLSHVLLRRFDFNKARLLIGELYERRQIVLGEFHPDSIYICSAQICHSFLSSRNMCARNV